MNTIKQVRNILKDYKSGGVVNGVSNDPAWFDAMLDYETVSGSASGGSLGDFGIRKDKWGDKYPYLFKNGKVSKEDAKRFIREEYMPKVKDYPEDVQKRLVDYAYNTGRNIEDVLLHASGLTDLESVQTKNTDFDTFNKNRDAIIKNMSDPAFILNIDKSKHEILKDTWKRKGTPDVYDKTSKGRIDMWNESTDLGMVPVKSKSSVAVVNTPPDTVSKTENSSGMSWSDKDISGLLSRGIAAQDWRLESLTDTGMGVPFGEPANTGAVANTFPVKKDQSTAVPANSTVNSGGYKLVKGGTEAVAKYQEMLKSEGLYDGNIDGAWGPKTQAAYEKLIKRTKGLDVNKKVPVMKKGGYIRHMAEGGMAGDPPKGRRFQSLKDKNVIIIEGQDGKTYSSMDGGSTYSEAPPQIKDAFTKEFSEQRNQKGLNWQRIGGDGIENDSSVQQPKIQPLPAIGKRPFSVVSTGRKYIDNRFQSNSGEAPKNPGLTMDPTNWGQDIFGGKKAGNSSVVPSVSEAPMNPGLTTDGSSWGQEITPGLNYSDISNPFAPEGNPLDSNPSVSGPNDSGMTDIDKRIQDEIEKRKKDVEENAASTIEDYGNLADRTNSRNLQGLVVSTAGRLLQDRRVSTAFRRPNYINQRYRGYSAQQIAEESQAGSGAGVEMVKQMGRDPSAITARLAPIIMARMGYTEGKVRKAYNDSNMSLERAKYGELNEIRNVNDKLLADQRNQERDMGNRTIAGISSDVGKFLQSLNQTDGKTVDIKSQVNQRKINDLYSLDNSSIEMDIAKMDYGQQKDYLDKRINDIRTELETNKINLDEDSLKKLEDNLAAYERMRDKANIKNSLK
jgi:hypothetical protein